MAGKLKTDVDSVRRLLRILLQFPGMGPALRRSARKALAVGHMARLHAVAGAVIKVLARRGDLIRVVADGDGPQARVLYWARRSGRLLDLTALASGHRRLPGVDEHGQQASHEISATPPASLEADAGLGVVSRFLAAMESAQNLQIGDPLSGDREVVLDGILRLLSQFLPDVRLCIMLHGEQGDTVTSGRIVFATGDASGPLWLRSRAMGTTMWIDARQELPASVREVLWPRPEGAEVTEGAESGFTGCIALPLYDPTPPGAEDGVEVGELGLVFVAAAWETSRENVLRMGRRVADFVARRWRRQNEVNQRIHTDSLTGVCNRAFFDSQLILELERAKRQKAALTVVLGDLDHFKQINDRYGHQAGDKVLCAVAQELQKGLRRIDHICRIGGEEFALILPDTPAPAAQEAVMRLLARLNRMQISLAPLADSCRATLSFGVVTFPAGGDEPSELYRKADAMLYRSKRTGRNRCSIWNPTGEPLTLLPPVATG
jgi:diguanylate cyclase (GGDEF)-like protein